jgi:hypothetical protein
MMGCKRKKESLNNGRRILPRTLSPTPAFLVGGFSNTFMFSSLRERTDGTD